MAFKGSRRRQAGFSLLEMTVVVILSVIITVIAVPEYLSAISYLRIAGDLRVLNGMTAQAKMRAAANFTHARVLANLTGNTLQLEVWNKALSGGNGCWEAELKPGTCIDFSGAPAPSGPTIALSQNDAFGFGTLTTGPTPGQATISQGAQCYIATANKPDGAGAQMANTACIEFNSRGIPVDNSNIPLATGAIYITNSKVVDGITVSATGSIQAWLTPKGQSNWHAQ